MSASRNSPLPMRAGQARSIDQTSGPRDANDPRNVRASQQSQRSLLAGLGLRYAVNGQLEVDPASVSLEEQVGGQDEESLEAAARALDLASGSPTTIYASGETAQTTASTSEQDYLRITVDPDLLVQNRGLHLVTLGKVFNDSGANRGFIFRVYMGSTELFRADTGSIITASANLRVFALDLWLTADEDSQAQSMQGRVFLGAPSDALVGVGSLATAPLFDNMVARYKSSVDMTIRQELAVTLELSASSANYYAQLEHTTLFHF